MQPIELSDRPTPEVSEMPVTVVLERRPARGQPWIDTLWSAVGVVVAAAPADPARAVRREADGSARYLVGGLRLHLYPDECESYYYNLLSPRPRCYVVAHAENDGDRPEPFLVTMSFDEAHAYLEGGDEIYAVAVPPEVYRWTEAYVLTHYAPQKRRKRKRQDWRNPNSLANPPRGDAS